MTTDEIQLLREFRSEVPVLDEEAMRWAYAYATRESQRRWRQSLRLASIPLIRRRFVIPAAAALCATAASAIALTGTLGGSVAHNGNESGSVRGTSQGVGLPVGSISAAVAHPLSDATQISLARASNTLGAPVVLPDTSLVTPSDVGPVWTRTLRNPDKTQVAVTFPTQNLILIYGNPGYSLATWERIDSLGTKINIEGVPALFFGRQGSGGGANALALPTSGVDILIIGRYDQATLKSVARSILTHRG